MSLLIKLLHKRPKHLDTIKHHNTLLHKLKLFVIVTLSFCPIYALIEIDGMGDGEYITSLGNTVYWYFTSITTIGYGDYSPKTTLGKISFIVVICWFAIFLLVSVVDAITTSLSTKNELIKKGKYIMDFDRHVVVFFDERSVRANNYLFLKIFIRENISSALFANNQLVFVNNNCDGHIGVYDCIQSINGEISSRSVPVVQLISHSHHDKMLLSRLSLEKAKHVYLLSNHTMELTADSVTYDLASKLTTSYHVDPKNITCELVDYDERQRYKDMGIFRLVRPNRVYPEILVCATTSDNSQSVLEELMSTSGNSIVTFPCGNAPIEWMPRLMTFLQVGVGTLIGYIDKDGNIVLNPPITHIIKDVTRLVFISSSKVSKDYVQYRSIVTKLTT